MRISCWTPQSISWSGCRSGSLQAVPYSSPCHSIVAIEERTPVVGAVLRRCNHRSLHWILFAPCDIVRDVTEEGSNIDLDTGSYLNFSWAGYQPAPASSTHLLPV